MSTIKRHYEISVWEDIYKGEEKPIEKIDYTSSKLQEPEENDYNIGTFLEERKIAVIGSDTMESQGKVSEPKLNLDIKGKATLTFDIYRKYYDNFTGELVENPFYQYITNERKVKLYYDDGTSEDKWRDFIITSISPESTNYKVSVIATDLAVVELSKIGFNKTFNSELQNNTGTINELGEKVLDGTVWELGEDSEDILQFQTDTLVEVQVTSETQVIFEVQIYPNDDFNIEKIIRIKPGSKIYTFYSCVSKSEEEKKTELPILFLYEPSGSSDLTWNTRIASDKDFIDNIIQKAYFGVANIKPSPGEKTNKYIGYNNLYFPKKYFDIITTEEEKSGINILYTKKGKRLIQNQITHYDELLNRYVKEYKDEKGNVIYGYEDAEYEVQPLVQNLILNGDEQKSLDGWSLLEDKNMRNISMSWGSTRKNFDNATSKRKGRDNTTYIDLGTQMFWPNRLYNYTLLTNLIVNDGFQNNLSKVQQLAVGDKFRIQINHELSKGYEELKTLAGFKPFLIRLPENKSLGDLANDFSALEVKTDVYKGSDKLTRTIENVPILVNFSYIPDKYRMFDYYNILSKGWVKLDGNWEDWDPKHNPPEVGYRYRLAPYCEGPLIPITAEYRYDDEEYVKYYMEDHYSSKEKENFIKDKSKVDFKDGDFEEISAGIFGYYYMFKDNTDTKQKVEDYVRTLNKPAFFKHSQPIFYMPYWRVFDLMYFVPKEDKDLWYEVHPEEFRMYHNFGEDTNPSYKPKGVLSFEGNLKDRYAFDKGIYRSDRPYSLNEKGKEEYIKYWTGQESCFTELDFCITCDPREVIKLNDDDGTYEFRELDEIEGKYAGTEELSSNVKGGYFDYYVMFTDTNINNKEEENIFKKPKNFDEIPTILLNRETYRVKEVKPGKTPENVSYDCVIYNRGKCISSKTVEKNKRMGTQGMTYYYTKWDNYGKIPKEDRITIEVKNENIDLKFVETDSFSGNTIKVDGDEEEIKYFWDGIQNFADNDINTVLMLRNTWKLTHYEPYYIYNENAEASINIEPYCTFETEGTYKGDITKITGISNKYPYIRSKRQNEVNGVNGVDCDDDGIVYDKTYYDAIKKEITYNEKNYSQNELSDQHIVLMFNSFANAATNIVAPESNNYQETALSKILFTRSLKDEKGNLITPEAIPAASTRTIYKYFYPDYGYNSLDRLVKVPIRGLEKEAQYIEIFTDKDGNFLKESKKVHIKDRECIYCFYSELKKLNLETEEISVVFFPKEGDNDNLETREINSTDIVQGEIRGQFGKFKILKSDLGLFEIKDEDNNISLFYPIDYLGAAPPITSNVIEITDCYGKNKTSTKCIDIKDIVYDYIGYTPNNKYKPIINLEGTAYNSITATESNVFNIIQKLCEVFNSWVKINLEHDANTGKLILDEKNKPKGTISFHKYIGSELNFGFKNGLNLNSIQRTDITDDITTKIVVKQNSNEFGNDKFCTITRSKYNVLGGNDIYNFDYYINQGILEPNIYEVLYNTYGAPLNKIREQTIIYMNDMKQLLVEISQLKVQVDFQKEQYNAATNEITLNKKNFENLTSYTWSYYLDHKKEIDEAWSKDGLVSLFEQYKEQAYFYTDARAEAFAAWQLFEALYNEKVSEYNSKEQLISTLKQHREAILKEFYNIYHEYIREGSWISEDYLDDDKYYFAAEEVLKTSAQPKVTYNFNVVDIGALEEFKGYNFKLGDKTYIEDPEFFGYNSDETPYKEEVTISGMQINLDSPDKNTITVQNYRTQFQDLFQRMAATVQAVEYHTGNYKNTKTYNN